MTDPNTSGSPLAAAAHAPADVSQATGDGDGAGAGMPGALIVPGDPALLQAEVCGIPIILRAVWALERAGASIHVLKTPTCPDSLLWDIQTATAARVAKGRVAWASPLESVPTGAGLFVVRLPGAFDYRLCSAIARVPDPHEKVIRFRRPGESEALLWFVGKQRAGELLHHLQGERNTPSALADFFARHEIEDVDPGRSVCEIISNEGSRRTAEEKLLAQARKDSDTWVARNFDRRISAWMTRWLVGRPITPNQVTVVATALGLGGAALLALGTHRAQIAGASLLVLSIVIDGCDGEIARLKFMESEFGRKLDFFLDNVVNTLAIFAVGAGYYLQGGAPFYLYASFANAGAALASVFPVYWLFFRKDAATVVTRRRGKRDLSSLLRGIAGRDFVYLIFVLALAGKAHWFTVLCLGGIGVFLAFVLLLLARRLMASRV